MQTEEAELFSSDRGMEEKGPFMANIQYQALIQILN